MRKFPVHLVCTAIIAFMAACGSAKQTAVTPTETPSRLLPPLPESRIEIPVKVYMRPLLSLMDSITSREFTNDQWPNYTQSSCDYRYKYRFVRSPFQISCANNKVSIRFRGNYQIAGSRCVCAFDKQVTPWASGSCGFGSEPLRRVDVAISSTLSLLPNHQVTTATRLESLQALDKCQVTIMNNDMTATVMDSIKVSVNSYCSTFDQFVQALNNHELLQRWRSKGSQVMPVSSYGYLNLNPSLLRIGRFNIIKDTLYFSLAYYGNPQFSSDSQRLVTNQPLPYIQTADTKGGIATYLDAVYEYKFFNQLLNDSLRDKPFDVEGRTFVIKDVQIGGTNEGKIRVDVAFSGSRKGVLHISGTPLLDTATQVLSMPDVRFSLDTKDMLMNIAKGLFRKRIMKQLKDQAVLDIAALISRNKAAIEARMNQPVTPWMSTAGTLQEIRLVGLLPQKDYIQVQAFIRANIALIGHPPGNLLNMSF